MSQKEVLQDKHGSLLSQRLVLDGEIAEIEVELKALTSAEQGEVRKLTNRLVKQFNDQRQRQPNPLEGR